MTVARSTPSARPRSTLVSPSAPKTDWRDRQAGDDGASRGACPGTVVCEHADDPQVHGRVDALEADPRADRQAVLGGQRGGDERVGFRPGRQVAARRQRQVVDPRLAVRIDADEGDRGRQRSRTEQPGPEIGPPLERGGHDLDAGCRLDRREGRVGQAGLSECGDAQLGPADHRRDRPIDRRADPRVGGEPGIQDGDAEGDADRRERRTQGPCAQAPPRETVETAHPAQSPRLASRAISAVASWSARRPSSIVSRIRPSPMTCTRSA